MGDGELDMLDGEAQDAVQPLLAITRKSHSHTDVNSAKSRRVRFCFVSSCRPVYTVFECNDRISHMFILCLAFALRQISEMKMLQWTCIICAFDVFYMLI